MTTTTTTTTTTVSVARRRARGEDAVYRHKATGLWTCAIDIGRSASGNRLRRVLYAKTRAELLRKVADERARNGGVIQARAIGTFGDWVEQWLADELEPNRSPSTWASYSTVWRVHAAPVVAHVRLDDLTLTPCCISCAACARPERRRVWLTAHYACCIAPLL